VRERERKSESARERERDHDGQFPIRKPGDRRIVVLFTFSPFMI